MRRLLEAIAIGARLNSRIRTQQMAGVYTVLIGSSLGRGGRAPRVPRSFARRLADTHAMNILLLADEISKLILL